MINAVKKLARMIGVDVRKYSPQTSDMARMGRLLLHHTIDLVLDVGANTGQYAKFLREAGYSGKIVSFEPLSTPYAALLKASRKDPRWEIAPRAALGDRDSEITINIAGNSQSSSALPMLDSHTKAAPDAAYIDSETVKLYRLDTIAPQFLGEKFKSVYLKIDVQGLESQVLEGAAKILPGIKGLQLELSLVPLYEGEPVFRDMLDKLDRLGYELYAVSPVFTDPASGRLLQLDGVFFRK